MNVSYLLSQYELAPPTNNYYQCLQFIKYIACIFFLSQLLIL